ncbi:hypothetical protein [Tropicimonas sp. IMCC34043]|uniref:hypothetical protein n=1 Tax=Tropicimonas sp. IMCC34043 TaxID=2248760 RepID=UPI000E285798|nr:hypothetical protein [Tropicimonas sp. IMCC34043]
MPKQGMTGQSFAEQQATQTDAISLHELTLIGVFGTDTDRSALVRYATGKIEKVALGAKLGGATVVAIDKDSLSIETGKSVRKLEMPAG